MPRKPALDPDPVSNKRAPVRVPILVLASSAAACTHTGSAEVVIAGGGLAGLVTAYELEKQGIGVHVLEAGDALGGRVLTARYGDGLIAEAGLQELWEGNPLLSIAKELGIELDSEPGEPFSSVVIDGKLYPFVQDTSDLYFDTFLSADEKKSLSTWLATAAETRKKAIEKGLADPEVLRLQGLTFADWMAEAKLTPLVSGFLKRTIECELAAEWDTFSALYGLLELEVFLGGGVPNYHVRGGNYRLIEAIAAAVKGPKTLSARVSKVVRRGGESVEVHYVKNGRVHTLEARRAVLAVPFIRVHQIQIEPPLSEAHWDAIRTLGFGQYAVVHLLVDKTAHKLWEIDGETPMPVLSDGSLGVIYGIAEPSPPEQPLEVFSLLVYGMPVRAFHMFPHGDRVQEIVAELDKLWPGFAGHVKGSQVYTYHPAAIALWPPSRSPLDAGSELIRKGDQGLYFAGDWTLNGHSDGAARSAIRVARQLAAELR